MLCSCGKRHVGTKAIIAYFPFQYPSRRPFHSLYRNPTANSVQLSGDNVFSPYAIWRRSYFQGNFKVLRVINFCLFCHSGLSLLQITRCCLAACLLWVSRSSITDFSISLLLKFIFSKEFKIDQTGHYLIFNSSWF